VDKAIQNTVYLGVVLIALFVGFFAGYLVSSRNNIGQNPSQNLTANMSAFVRLPPDGVKVAQGLVSPCGANEALATHNCGIANSIKSTIIAQLAAGQSIEQVRQSLITLYGEKIFMK